MFSLDEKFMMRALELAAMGSRAVGHNPMVGAVFVRNGVVIGEGFHERFGGAHAEINAINNTEIDLRGADLYVTLEPCCVVGKTGACTDVLSNLGLNRVVVAMTDPNPQVDGKGVDLLEKSGVSVEVGVCEREARLLNQRFIKNMKFGLPYLTMKSAMSLDGKVCCVDGSSKWISSKESRVVVHELRAKVDGLIVGAGTVVEDDPHLGVRFVEGCDPKRIVLDRTLRTSVHAQVYRDKNVMVFCEEDAKCDDFESKGIELIFLEKGFGLIDVLKKIYELGLYDLMLECGPGLAGAFFREDLIDRFLFFLAPSLIGGSGGVFGGNGVETMADLVRLEEMKTKIVGSDIMVEALRRIY